jgi:hypothetical protein
MKHAVTKEINGKLCPARQTGIHSRIDANDATLKAFSVQPQDCEP